MKKMGKIYGVGVGPGAVDLLSVRADKLVREAKYIAFFRKAGRAGHARQIASTLLSKDVIELAMEYPITTEIPLSDQRYSEVLSEFYKKYSNKIISLSQTGIDLVILCEGDPFFYGSFMHIYSRVKDKCPVEVVPAITGMSAAWTATDIPITWGDDILTVLMGTLDKTTLENQLQDTNAAIIMKIGRNLPKIKKALERTGRFYDAFIVEYAAMDKQTVQRLSDYNTENAPYFSIIILHGQGRRP
ncbi:MAG: precorrin-2 C(20)-methyltransferase [Alphaproteobacteria bacterium]|nr:MAG: precorrin-2 C(20)-methyltransferase [Alphaproteobacteria bacterium]|tara:strand:+ start:196 stop:927 length:732 start_codon:yes stop_codon:yes gene_type:complete